MVTAEISITPIGTGSSSISDYVATAVSETLPTAATHDWGQQPSGRHIGLDTRREVAEHLAEYVGSTHYLGGKELI